MKHFAYKFLIQSIQKTARGMNKAGLLAFAILANQSGSAKAAPPTAPSTQVQVPSQDYSSLDALLREAGSTNAAPNNELALADQGGLSAVTHTEQLATTSAAAYATLPAEVNAATRQTLPAPSSEGNVSPALPSPSQASTQGATQNQIAQLNQTPQAGTPQAGTPQAGSPQAGTPQDGTAQAESTATKPTEGTPQSKEEAQAGSTAVQSESGGIFNEILKGAGTKPTDFAKLAGAILAGLAGLALLLWQFFKHRGEKQGNQSRTPRALQLTATLPLGQKRQILLVRVRDTELALAATEHGISLLSEIGTSNKSALGNALRNTQGTSTARVIEETQVLPLAPAAEMHVSSMTGGPDAKSEILRKAIEAIESRRRPGSQREREMKSNDSEDRINPSKADSTTESSTKATKRETRSNGTAASPRSTLPPGPEAQRFKKFFANSYKQTAKPEQRTETRPTATSTARMNFEDESAIADESQTENVAQLIREKLKQMRSIS